ncbi:MAG: M14-type cytosolic carboxypeptidase [Gammaproteobacteria bacterium]|nr:M14-type cytosolic carboxypeptidase [Gammaproteobacteria bacterium]MDH3535767.1 M14-type cytosolic carboxypeptidase [Gammaproteobacteria bacterium]
MIISSQFDGGNIECSDSSDPATVLLSIRKDNRSDFYQWFYFRAANVKDIDCRYVIGNAGGAAYQKGWENYQAVASYDREFWFRIRTAFDGENLVLEHNSSEDQVYFAYFAPYSMERHADLIAFAQTSDRCEAQTLGMTLDGQTIDCLRFGEDEDARRKIWMVARQHPGETMAEWWMEGLINRLVDYSDPVVNAILDKAVIYLVPNMNPDGSRRGHLRTNAVGSNLNREWDNPTPEQSPEVLCVLEKISQTGLDFGLDVHGDEALPYNFIAGTEGIPGWSRERQQQLELFKMTLANINPDFQTEHGYPPNSAGNANMSYCSNSLAERFAAPVMTLEMPFKDAIGSPDAVQGWSPERCGKLAHSCLDALHLCWQQLLD